ncbi:hypothetical protein GCM10027174_30450 [Salinifilum aidingensis]
MSADRPEPGGGEDPRRHRPAEPGAEEGSSAPGPSAAGEPAAPGGGAETAAEPAPDPGPGRRLAIDVGGTRIGVAISDPAPVLATPVETVRRDRRRGSDLRRLSALVAEYGVVEVVVGLPVTMAGEEGHSAGMARKFGDALAPRIAPVPLRFTDERLTTVTASRMLSERGVRGKQQRVVVDQAAAVEILQAWLDARGRSAGRDSW